MIGLDLEEALTGCLPKKKCSPEKSSYTNLDLQQSIILQIF